jgi:hypothetical protein
MNDYPWSRGEPPHEDPAAPPPRNRLPFHPLAATFPLLDRASPEFQGMIASVRDFGLQEPITLYQGMILDGRNRLLACEEARVEPRFEQFDDTEQTPLSFVLSKNLYRRHLSEAQRAARAEEMVTTKHGGDRKSEFKTPIGVLKSGPVTIDKAAALWCVKKRAVERASFVREHAVPEVFAKVKAGTMGLWRASELAKEDEETQREAPEIKFARRTPKPRAAARPVTVNAIRELPDEQFLALVLRDLPRLNRALAREGKQIVITDLPQKGPTF